MWNDEDNNPYSSFDHQDPNGTGQGETPARKSLSHFEDLNLTDLNCFHQQVLKDQ